jgi:hypothetical protein
MHPRRRTPEGVSAHANRAGCLCFGAPRLQTGGVRRDAAQHMVEARPTPWVIIW